MLGIPNCRQHHRFQIGYRIDHDRKRRRRQRSVSLPWLRDRPILAAVFSGNVRRHRVLVAIRIRLIRADISREEHRRIAGYIRAFLGDVHLMRLCGSVEISAHPFVTDNVQRLAAETGERVKGPVVSDVVDPAKRSVRNLRDPVTNVHEHVVMKIDIGLERTEARIVETLVRRRVRASVRIARRAGTYRMSRVRLVKQAPLRGNGAIRSDVIARRDPHLVPGPARGYVVENDVVIVAVDDAETDGAGRRARWCREIIGTECDVANDYIVGRNSERVAFVAGTTDDDFAGSRLSRDCEKRVVGRKVGFLCDEPGYAKNAGPWSLGIDAGAKAAWPTVVQGRHFKDGAASTSGRRCTPTLRSWKCRLLGRGDGRDVQ